MLRIKADQNIYRLQDFLPPDVRLELYDPDKGLPPVENTDALLIRTVTHVTPESLPDNHDLKFVGTASSGSDHMDIEYLSEKGLTVADAKGCNARAVAEYVITSLLLWSIKTETDLSSLSFGIVGVGCAGSNVLELLTQFGLNTVAYDPPRELRDTSFISASLEEVLNCDVLSFHVPFSHKGEHATRHWLDESKLAERKFRLIINAARGGVIDEESLMKQMAIGAVDDVIIDVWEHEPDFNPDLADQAFIATPHIAGYSEQAKLNATRLLVEELAKVFDLKLPAQKDLYADKALALAHLKYSFYEMLLRLNPLREYDADLRNIAGRPDKIALFRKLRVDRPLRYEYPFLELEKELLDQFPQLITLGCKPIPAS